MLLDRFGGIWECMAMIRLCRSEGVDALCGMQLMAIL